MRHGDRRSAIGVRAEAGLGTGARPIRSLARRAPSAERRARLKLLNADFVTSAAQADGIPRDEVARVALAGRSNVGKSSLINALCRLKIARTSAAPGKTRLLNFYRITMEGGPGGPGRWPVYLVDLPGYGYARGGDASVEELAEIAREYYEDSDRRSAERRVPRPRPCSSSTPGIRD